MVSLDAHVSYHSFVSRDWRYAQREMGQGGGEVERGSGGEALSEAMLGLGRLQPLAASLWTGPAPLQRRRPQRYPLEHCRPKGCPRREYWAGTHGVSR